MPQYLIFKTAVPLEKIDAFLFTQLLRKEDFRSLTWNYGQKVLHLDTDLSDIEYVECFCSRTPPFTKAIVVKIPREIGSDKVLIKYFKANYQGCINAGEIELLKSVVHAKHSLAQINEIKKSLNKLFSQWNHTTGTRVRSGDNTEVEKLEAFMSQRESALKLIIESSTNIVKRKF